MFVVEREPKSIVSEAYRTLRTNIQYSSLDKKIKSLVVTSSEPAEGKSTVVGNISLLFGQEDKKVIVIDCDLRKPTIHKYFKVSNSKGLTDVLVGQAKIEDSIQVYNKNVHILTAGKIPPNPAEMISSNLMTTLIRGFEQKYDMVILDSPPLQAVTDAQILSAKVDGTILVVRSEATKQDSAIEAKNLLDKVGANLIGAVLHRAKQSKGKYYYYYAEDGHKEKRKK